MSRSCHSVTFSSAGTTAARTMRARPVRFSLSTGFRLCGIAEEPFWPGWKNSSASRTSLRCRWRTSVASRSMPLAITPRVQKNAAWRSRGMIWVETGSACSPSLSGDVFFHARIEMREGADRAADRGHGDLRPRGDQARAVAGELGVVAGELQAERGRFGVDAVAAADGQGVFVLERARLQRRQHGVEVRQQQVGRLGQLHRQAGVQHVGTGHALVHEAAVGTDRLGQPGQEGDHVVAGFALDRVDALDVGGVRWRPAWGRPSRGWCGRRLPGSRRSGPCLRRPAPRSRTRCDSGSRAPRWRPSRVWSNGEPSLPCPMPVRGPAKPLLAIARGEGKHGFVDAGPGGAGPGVMIDVALAGDNAVVVGMAVAGLPARQKRPAIMLGIARRDGDPHRAGRGGAAVAGDHRAAAGRRPAAAVGLLEDVSRTAARPSRRPTGGGWQDAAPGDDADHPGGCVHEPGQRPGGRRRGA